MIALTLAGAPSSGVPVEDNIVLQCGCAALQQLAGLSRHRLTSSSGCRLCPCSPRYGCPEVRGMQAIAANNGDIQVGRSSCTQRLAAYL